MQGLQKPNRKYPDVDLDRIQQAVRQLLASLPADEFSDERALEAVQVGKENVDRHPLQPSVCVCKR